MSEIVFRKLDQAFAIIIPTYQWKKLRLRDVNYNTHSPTASKCWKYNLNPGLCDSMHDAITQQPKIGVILSVYLWGNGGSEQWHNLPSLKTWVNITTGNRTWTSHNAAFLQRGHIGERRRYYLPGKEPGILKYIEIKGQFSSSQPHALFTISKKWYSNSWFFAHLLCTSWFTKLYIRIALSQH